MRFAILVAAAAMVFASAAEARTGSRGGAVHVRGYTRSNGTYVAPSVRTSPNRTRVDNWSSKPNVNPYTGKTGTKDPFAPKTK